MPSMNPSLLVEIGADVKRLRSDMDKSIEEISRLRRESDIHARAMKSTFENSIAGISSAWVTMTAKATAAIYAISKAWEMADSAAAYQEQVDILNRLATQYKTTGDVITNNVIRALDGMISKADAVRITLGGLSKGMSPDQMYALAEAATILGDRVGQDAKTAFEDLSQALESSRTKSLKNYQGSIFDLKAAFGDLATNATDAQKAQLLYAIVIEDAAKKQKEMNGAVRSYDDQMAIASSKLKDVGTALGGVVLKGLGYVASWFVAAAQAASLFNQAMTKSQIATKEFLGADESELTNMRNRLKGLQNDYVSLNNARRALIGQSPVGGTSPEAKRDLTDAANAQKKVTGNILAQIKAEQDLKKAEQDRIKAEKDAIKQAEREKRELYAFTQECMEGYYTIDMELNQALQDAEAASIERTKEQLEELNKLYDGVQAKLDAISNTEIMNAFSGTGVGGPMADIMSMMSDKSIYDEAMQNITDYYEKRAELGQDFTNYEADMERVLWQKKTAMASAGFGAMSALAQAFYNASGQKNKAMFKVYQATAAAEAIVSTYAGAARALKDFPWPYNMVVAGIVTAAGMARVAAIYSTNPGGGISSVAGGTGSGSVPKETFTEEPEKAPTQSQVINIYVEGNIVDNEKFAREILPSILKAQADNVR